jgi:hypothetical protein
MAPTGVSIGIEPARDPPGRALARGRREREGTHEPGHARENMRRRQEPTTVVGTANRCYRRPRKRS